MHTRSRSLALVCTGHQNMVQVTAYCRKTQLPQLLFCSCLTGSSFWLNSDEAVELRMSFSTTYNVYYINLSIVLK